ncbi:MAG: hypothetical protein QOH00_1724 [Gaiellales bacterium]|jgi:hypothetical protein|nr:hypothetical protein [Gaiellales bacterium]
MTLAYLLAMALLTASRSAAKPTGWAHVGESSRRERVHMELLVERARAAWRHQDQPPMCDISTRGRSTAVPWVRNSE